MVDIVETLMKMGAPEREAVLRNDPVPAPRVHPVISVDDHAIEPPDTFTGRLPA